MYTKIWIPENNSLKSKIEELYEWCDKRDNDDELGKTYFNEPIDEDKLNKWEEANGVKIPETYKEWLRFTEKCLIDGSSAMFWGTDDFHHNFMPDNLTVIGEMSGDGEVVCFSNDNGEFMGYYEGDITYRTNDFSQVIDQIFERNSAWGGLSKEDIELFMEFCERNKKKKAEKMSKILLKVPVKAGENGKIFGGVSAKEIPDIRKKQGMGWNV